LRLIATIARFRRRSRLALVTSSISAPPERAVPLEQIEVGTNVCCAGSYCSNIDQNIIGEAARFDLS